MKFFREKRVFLLFFIAIQYFSLFSHECLYDELLYDGNNEHNVYAEMHIINQQYAQPSNNWYFSGRVIATPDYSAMRPAHYSIIAHQASPELKNYFSRIVSPLIYDAAIKNHYVAIPGYVFPNGLRSCIGQLSQFLHSDAALIASLIKRLETYCTRIEGILCKGKNYEFCDSISYEDQIKLVHAYADFLKEFYARLAPYIFEKQSRNSLFMRQAASSIKWGYYDASDAKSCVKKIEQRYAASVNGNLGAVYKAL